jgi:D-serine deaminase-like pyridoxal phosphate-dependent protein
MNLSFPMLGSHNIQRPTLLLDREKAIRNIARIARKATSAGIGFRPHFKTHQSAEIGNWFRQFGVDAITVSSLDMALYFSANGWKDITVAFAANLLEKNKINSLAQRIRLHLLVDTLDAVSALDGFLQHQVVLWIDIDVGYHRTGIPWNDFNQTIQVARAISRTKNLAFGGILTHSGHTYHAQSVAEIQEIHRDGLKKLLALKGKLAQAGISSCPISIGDTPSASVATSFAGADEIRPGNFLFYDLTQSKLGACTEEEIAVTVACPVATKVKEGNKIIIYGGAVHLSKEFLLDEQDRMVFGYVAQPCGNSWGAAEKRAPIVSLSQEHGIIQVDDALFQEIKVGELLSILPVHSCLTSDLYETYLTLDGKRIERRRSNDEI